MIKIGLFGVGHLGKIHLRLLKEIPQLELVGFFDPNKAIAEKISEEYKVPAYKNAQELMRKVEAVDIVSPTTTHFELAKQALSEGKHLFIEKPLCTNSKEGKILMDLWKSTNLVAQVGHVERFNPAWLAAKDRIGNPKFLEVHRLAMFNPRGTDVSVVLDLMIHDLDIILSVVPSKVKSVVATGIPIISDTPDIANARISFENGCVANVTASRLSMKNMRKIRLFQSNAYMSLDFLAKKTEIITLSNENDEAVTTFPLDLGDKGTRYITFEQPETPPVNAIKEELIQFANSILNKTKAAVDMMAGFAALKLAEDINEAIAQNDV